MPFIKLTAFSVFDDEEEPRSLAVRPDEIKQFGSNKDGSTWIKMYDNEHDETVYEVKESVDEILKMIRKAK